LQKDHEYGWVGLIYVISLYFNYNGTSIGVDKCSNLDVENGDNGLYLIGEGFKIFERKFYKKEDNNQNIERTQKIKKCIFNKINYLNSFKD